MSTWLRGWSGLRSLVASFRSKATPVAATPPETDQPDELQADAPLGQGTEDALGRLPFALRIADLIRERQSPQSLVIAIYGRWGDGKTTVVNFVAEALEQDANVAFVRYNPWLVGDRDEILKSFFETLASAIGERPDSKTVEAADAIRRYSGYLAPLLPPIEALHRATKGISTRSAESKKDRISSLLSAAGRRVVVAIDDIDRLERDEIANILKLVRLVGDFEQTVYLLAFDRRVVGNAISERYGDDGGSGTSFLEKIVQLPLVMPPPEADSLEALALSALDKALAANEAEMAPEEVSEFGVRFREGIAPGIDTPRMAMQFSNAVAFALPMVKGEANLVDVISVEALRSLYPAVHEFTSNNGELVLGLEQGTTTTIPEAKIEKTRSAWGRAVEVLEASRRDSAMALVKATFPRFAAELGENEHFGTDWLGTWRSQKRAASPEYFERYFTYHVSKRQVPDLAVADLLARLESLDEGEVHGLLLEHLRQGRADSLLRSLRDREQELSEQPARVLAKALVRLGGELPRPRMMFSFRTPFEQGAILISRLLERITKGRDRALFAHELVAAANPLPFAAHIARWIRSDPKVPETDRVLDPQAEKRILEELVARIVNESTTGTPLYNRYPLDAPLLLGVWATFGDLAPLRAYVERTFSEIPDNAVSLLKTYLPVAFSLGTGIARSADLERDNYEAIERVVDPASVAAALRRVYPDLTTPDSYPHGDLPEADRKLAAQFLYLHEHPGGGNAHGDDEQEGPSPIIEVTPDREP